MFEDVKVAPLAAGEVPGPLASLSALSEEIANALVNSPDFLSCQVSQHEDIGDDNELFWLNVRKPNGQTFELRLSVGTPLSSAEEGGDGAPFPPPIARKWADSPARAALVKDAVTDEVAAAALKRLDEAHAPRTACADGMTAEEYYGDVRTAGGKL